MKLHSWQRRKYEAFNARGPDRWSSDQRVDFSPPRPRSATFRPDRYTEPEPMPEPANYKSKS